MKKYEKILNHWKTVHDTTVILSLCLITETNDYKSQLIVRRSYVCSSFKSYRPYSLDNNKVIRILLICQLLAVGR